MWPINFGKPNIVTVVGGGWSAKAIDKSWPKTKLPGIVVAVNEASVRLECHCAVSMDRLWTENRWEQLKAKPPRLYFFARKAALPNIRERPDWLVPFDCDHKSTKFSGMPGVLNGTNSGFCALNAVAISKPEIVFLIGFDMNRDPKTGHPYWHEPHPWAKSTGGTGAGRYREWAEEMKDAAEAFRSIGTTVYNVSLTSSITDFPKISPEQFRKMKEELCAI